jgi:hypothetical protein
VFFRAPTVTDAFHMLGRMFVPSGVGLPATVNAALTNQRELTFLLSLLVVLLPASFVLGKVIEAGRSRGALAARFAVMAVVPYAGVLVAAGTFSPFLYYQF